MFFFSHWNVWQSLDLFDSVLFDSWKTIIWAWLMFGDHFFRGNPLNRNRFLFFQNQATESVQIIRINENITFLQSVESVECFLPHSSGVWVNYSGMAANINIRHICKHHICFNISMPQRGLYKYETVGLNGYQPDWNSTVQKQHLQNEKCSAYWLKNCIQISTARSIFPTHELAYTEFMMKCVSYSYTMFFPLSIPNPKRWVFWLRCAWENSEMFPNYHTKILSFDLAEACCCQWVKFVVVCYVVYGGPHARILI